MPAPAPPVSSLRWWPIERTPRAPLRRHRRPLDRHRLQPGAGQQRRNRPSLRVMTSAGPNLRVNVNAPNLGRMLTGGALDGAAACSRRARSGDRYRTGHVIRMPRTRAVSARRPLSRPRPRSAMPATAGDTKPGDEQTRRQLDAQARREWVRRERTRCDGASRLPGLDAAALEQESPLSTRCTTSTSSGLISLGARGHRQETRTAVVACARSVRRDPTRRAPSPRLRVPVPGRPGTIPMQSQGYSSAATLS